MEYGLVWQDEFDGPAGQLPDPARWRFDIGTDWGNAQLEYDTDRPENVCLDGEGNLAITAREEAVRRAATTPPAASRPRASSRRPTAASRPASSCRSGRGSGRPSGCSAPTSTRWAGPPAARSTSWSTAARSPAWSTAACTVPATPAARAITGRHVLAQGGFNLGFHVFAVEWNEDAHHLVGRRLRLPAPSTRADLPAGATWVFDHPFFILLNVAVGGRWRRRARRDARVFPQTMLVDWVRVYGSRP